MQTVIARGAFSPAGRASLAMYHFFPTSETGLPVAPVAPGRPFVPLPAQPPRGSLRRVLDLLLRKPAYLSQFRRLGAAGKAAPRLSGLLVSVCRREGVIAVEVSKVKIQTDACSLTERGRELLALLDDLAGLDRLAGMIDSRAMAVLRRRRAGGPAAAAIRRVLRARDCPRWLDLMPGAGGFTAEDLLAAAGPDASRAEAGGMLHLFRTYCLVERIPLSLRQARRYRLTVFGLGIRGFVRRLAELDCVPDAASRVLRPLQPTPAGLFPAPLRPVYR